MTILLIFREFRAILGLHVLKELRTKNGTNLGYFLDIFFGILGYL